ncbi:MAG: tripartite tricarboxylate transporter TctB family protein [Acetobacterales bacterium]
MTREDFYVGLLLAAGFGATLWGALSFQYGSELAPGPGFAPVWLSVLGIALALTIAVTARRGAAAGGEAAERIEVDRGGLYRVAVTLAGLAAMLFLVTYLGLALSVLVFLLFLTLAVQRLPALTAIGASVATVCVIYLLFVRFLGVPAPAGPLGF